MRVNKRLFRRGLALITSVALAFCLTGCSMPELKESVTGLMERAAGPVQPEKLLDGSAWRNSDIDGAVTGSMDIRLQDDCAVLCDRGTAGRDAACGASD